MKTSKIGSFQVFGNRLRACLIYYAKFKTNAILSREAKALFENGYEVDVICLRDRKEEKIIDTNNGIHLFCIQARAQRENSLWRYLLNLLVFFFKTFCLLSWLTIQKRYQLIHITSPPDFLVFSAMLPKLLGAIVVLDIHDIGPELFMRKLGVPEKHPIIRFIKFLEYLSARFSHHIFTVTDIWRDKLQKRINGVVQCTTLLNVPDLDLFSPGAARKRRPSNGCNLFYHGSFEEHFGVDSLIRSMPIVKEHIPNVKLHLYGEGRLYQSMIKLSKELNLEGFVFFNGSVPFYKLPQILKKADIGVVPTKGSVFSDEAVSMKSLEYLTLGIPIVISGTRAHRYYYKEDMVVFFTPGDEKDLARAIILLYQKSLQERNLLIENAMKFLEKNNWQRIKEIYLQTIGSLIKQRNSL
jgi:glycosyltransferase involved in cell wall biosynthesis